MQLTQCCVVRSREPLVVGKARRSLGPSSGEPRTARAASCHVAPDLDWARRVPVTPTDPVEREVKLDADLAFVVPNLHSAVGRIEQQPERCMRTAYFDTPDFRLWRRGITLRHRTGEGLGPGIWTIKLPELGGGPTLDRTEIVLGRSPGVVSHRGNSPTPRDRSQLGASSNCRVDHDEATAHPS